MRYVIGILLLASPAVAGEPAYSWRSHPDDPDRTYLYLDGKQVGGWDYQNKQYRTFDGKEWGSPTKTAPVKPPVQIQFRAQITGTGMPVRPTVVTKQTPFPPFPPMRGLPRNRFATAASHIITEMTMRMVEEIPGAVVDSILQGNAKLTFEGSVKRP